MSYGSGLLAAGLGLGWYLDRDKLTAELAAKKREIESLQTVCATTRRDLETSRANERRMETTLAARAHELESCREELHTAARERDAARKELAAERDKVVQLEKKLAEAAKRADQKDAKTESRPS